MSTFRSRSISIATAGLVASVGCRSSPPSTTDSAGSGSHGGSSGGAFESGGGTATADGGQSGSGGVLPEPIPKSHPPPGFESCAHVPVVADCADGWCKLPPSCFVMGSPEGEWHRAREDEERVAVTLTHAIEIQQKELTRAQWKEITGLEPRGSESCTQAACPACMVSWWDAIHAANLLSERKDLEPCYEAVGCTGALGQDLACTGVADPDKSVYECEGYRLPTRAEAEYAARAGTWSTFYSGDITEYQDSASCLVDPALEKIAWYCFNSDNRAHVGGELQANGFGLRDMIGNLSEWNNDQNLFTPIVGGSDPGGLTGTHNDRFRFGGQFNHKSYLLRTAGLLSDPWNTHSPATGFRLVRTLPD